MARRYACVSFLLYIEFATESGTDFLKAREIHVDLLGMYVDDMEARQLDYAEAPCLANRKAIVLLFLARFDD